MLNKYLWNWWLMSTLGIFVLSVAYFSANAFSEFIVCLLVILWHYFNLHFSSNEKIFSSCLLAIWYLLWMVSIICLFFHWGVGPLLLILSIFYVFVTFVFLHIWHNSFSEFVVCLLILHISFFDMQNIIML